MSLKNIVLGFLIFIYINLTAYNVSMAENAVSVNASSGNVSSADKTTEEADGLQWETCPTLTEPSKYGANFQHYGHVNPNAPKGGTLNMIAIGTFDSLNPYIVAGTPPQGLVPLFGGLLYDTLLDHSLEQGGLSYPSIAMAIKYPKDYSWVKLKLNPKARWHDGAPITAEDVIWSFNVLQKYSSYYRGYYAMVDHGEIINPHEVKFVFKIANDRELPSCMGDLVILPKHWWEGVDKNGKKRDISKPTLEIPLGSSAYKIASFIPGKQIVWERVKDYWAQNLPVNVGRNNYDKIKYSYMRDENAQWEAFKKGGIVDYREEKVMQRWMRDYNFAAVRKGLVKKISYPNLSRYSSAGFYFNTRKAKFADPRVRKALALAFNFDRMNRLLFFNKNYRIYGYYNDYAFAVDGPPKGKELEVLEKVRDLVPSELFEKTFTLPSYSRPLDTRRILAQSIDLLKQAGYVIKKGHLLDKNGVPFRVEFLLSTPLNEPFTAFYAASLRKLGIDVSIRNVDNAQYVNRRSNYDFDIIYEDIPMSNSPGNEQLDYVGSALADVHGSHNYSGIKNPAVDKLIDILIHAPTREDVVAATKALNRVLQWGYYRVPSWLPKTMDIACWKKISFPPTQPAYKGFDFLSGWINTAATTNKVN